MESTGGNILGILLPILGIVGFIGFFVAIIMVAIHFSEKQLIKTKALYQKIADKFGLEVIPEQRMWKLVSRQPRISGNIGSMNFLLHNYTTGGKHKTHWTEFSIHTNAEVPNFSVSKEGFFSSIGKFFGGQDIIIGNKELDDMYVLKCKDEPYFIDLLSDETIANALIMLNKDFQGGFDMRKGTLTYREVGTITNEEQTERIEKLITLLTTVAARAIIPNSL